MLVEIFSQIIQAFASLLFSYTSKIITKHKEISAISKLGGADYGNYITTGTPGFSDLPTASQNLWLNKLDMMCQKTISFSLARQSLVLEKFELHKCS